MGLRITVSRKMSLIVTVILVVVCVSSKAEEQTTFNMNDTATPMIANVEVDTTNPFADFTTTSAVKATTTTTTNTIATSYVNFVGRINNFFDDTHGLFLILFSICLIAYVCVKASRPARKLVRRIRVRQKRTKETKYQKWLAVYSRTGEEVVCTPRDSLKTL